MTKSKPSHEDLLIFLLSSVYAFTSFRLGILAIASNAILLILGSILLVRLFLPSPAKKMVYPLMIPTFYYLIGALSSALKMRPVDEMLNGMDMTIFHESITMKWLKFHHPLLTESLYLVYVFFFVYVILSLVKYARSTTLHKPFYNGLFSVYWLGFFCYIFFPALGPYLTNEALLREPITQGWIFSEPIYRIICNGNNHSDLFPSLHCGVSGFILLFDLLYNRRRFYQFLPVVIGIWLSTLYLGFHYAIDLVGGGLLMLVGVSTAAHVRRKLRFLRIIRRGGEGIAV